MTMATSTSHSRLVVLRKVHIQEKITVSTPLIFLCEPVENFVHMQEYIKYSIVGVDIIAGIASDQSRPSDRIEADRRDDLYSLVSRLHPAPHHAIHLFPLMQVISRCSRLMIIMVWVCMSVYSMCGWVGVLP